MQAKKYNSKQTKLLEKLETLKVNDTNTSMATSRKGFYATQSLQSTPNSIGALTAFVKSTYITTSILIESTVKTSRNLINTVVMSKQTTLFGIHNTTKSITEMKSETSDFTFITHTNHTLSRQLSTREPFFSPLYVSVTWNQKQFVSKIDGITTEHITQKIMKKTTVFISSKKKSGSRSRKLNIPTNYPFIKSSQLPAIEKINFNVYGSYINNLTTNINIASTRLMRRGTTKSFNPDIVIPSSPSENGGSFMYRIFTTHFIFM